MRTTITLAPDVAAAVAELQHEEGVGVSAAVNALVRRALVQQVPERKPFVQRSRPMGARMDLRNIQEVLDELEGAVAAVTT